MEKLTDAELVARSRSGEVAAFEAIVERHRAALVSLADARLGSLADAEDVAQEAFVQAFFRLHQLRDPQALLPWLRRMTDRLALMRLRARREEPVAPGELEQAYPRGQVADLPHHVATDLLQRLPPAMRQTLVLTCLAGYTCGEAAALLGVREGTVKSRLSRARAILKEEFGMASKKLRPEKPKSDFTQRTIARLMREAQRLLAKGDVEAAGDRAGEVVEMQAQRGFAAGGDPEHLAFDPEAARIAGLALRERRRKDCENNAAQYGCRLEDLDWRLADVDVLSCTLGRPAGEGQDVWGIPLSRQRITMLDARDLCRRFHCSPLMLHDWVARGLPVLRCWPFVRFDWDRAKQWLKDNRITRWAKESDHDVDRPLRLIFQALARGQLTASQAEEIVDALEIGP
jgi:RNA polymerase sigma-70 factor (ECF subfamily)